MSAGNRTFVGALFAIEKLQGVLNMSFIKITYIKRILLLCERIFIVIGNAEA